ncbi:Ring finger domain [seawater metagenome]|uniref:Ring finger domain n=1 Tax=seawater metagenome TaxID=1561972 RepID=A0A5E8CLH1_9ZZZZ
MNEICAICLDDDSNLDLILPCNHKFHSQCILPWLKSNGTCPYCRACPKTSFQAFFSKAFIIPLRIKLEEENLRFSYPNKYHYRIDYKKIRRIYYKKNKVRFEILKKDGTFKFKSFYIKPITQLNLFSSALSYQLNFLANHI